MIKLTSIKIIHRSDKNEWLINENIILLEIYDPEDPIKAQPMHFLYIETQKVFIPFLVLVLFISNNH